MANHTPGPWSLLARGNPYEWNVVKYEDPRTDEDPWFIAAVFDGAEGRTAIANARLMAAAPEMFSILARLEQVLVNLGLSPTDEPLTSVRAALIKADPA